MRNNLKWQKKIDKIVFPEVYVVEASAGSGKTYALAKKYIQILMNSDLKSYEPPLKEILAITFTNKAAIEMKERILEFLKKIALDKFQNKDEEDDILSSLNIDKISAREKAYIIMNYIIKKYNFFQVQTIDSFINSLISGCAFKLGLSSNFIIKSDFSDYLKYSLDKFVDRASSDNKILKIFYNFLNQYIYIENKTSWFPKKNILNLISSMVSKINIYAGKFKKYDAKTSDLIKEKKKLLKIINLLKDSLPEGTNARFLNSLSSFLDKNKDSFDIENVSAYFKKDTFPVNEGYTIPNNVEKLWTQIRNGMTLVCELESSIIFNCYIDIFDTVFMDFESISRKDDVLFLEELNREARVIFGDKATTIPELYLRIATNFRHFLIDEFQDTNSLQWKNIFPLVEESLSTGGSLFYVGDRKQAIFRFRGGESALFDSVKKQFMDSNVREEVLDKNFRSNKEIVEFNNEIFSRENLRRFISEEKDIFSISDVDEIVGIFRDSRQRYKKDNVYGYVKVEFLASKNKDERNNIMKDKLINLVNELKDRFSSYKHIAILARDNDDVELITTLLLEKKIPAESEKTLNIRENSLIKEIVSFLKFLNSPIDNLYFTSFVIGDIFSKASGIDRDVVHDFIFKLRDRKQKDKKIYFYKEFRDRFKNGWNEFIEEFFKNVGFVPLYEFTISIINKFKIFDNFPLYQGFFMRFLEIIKEQEDENYNIVSFLEYFDNAKDDDLFINVSDTDSVKVLTIHKSKGLEFPIVIIPFLEIDIKIGTRNGSYVVYSSDDRLELIRLKTIYNDFSNKLKEKYREEYKRAFIDELNNIYVAFTRAKEELYIFIPEKSGNSDNLAKFLVSNSNLERGEKRFLSDKRKESILMEIPPSVYRDWIDFLKDEFVDEDSIKNKEKILKGEIFHFILSFIGNLFNKNKIDEIEYAIEKARAKFYFLDNFNQFKLKIEKLLSEPEFKQFFYLDDGIVYQEKEIVDLYGNTKRIDRLIVKKNQVWVIDYKSSKDSDYTDQIQEYINIVKDIYNTKTKGFLIYLDKLNIEEIDG